MFDDDDQKQEDAWNERRMVLVQHDMRQFLQAGFLQEPETVQETNCFLYAVPSQLEPPLLSQEATMAIPIHEKRKATESAALSSSNHHHAVQLLEKFKSFCSERNELANQMLDQQDFVASSITDHPRYPLTDGARALVLGRENIRLQEQKCRDMNIILDNALQVETDEHQLRRVLHDQKEVVRQLLEEGLPSQSRQLDEIEQAMIADLRQAAQQDIIEKEAKMRTLDERARSEAVELIQQGGTEIIESSDVLHACAYNLEPVYIQLLVSLISDHATQQHAINAFDRHGLTPLMTAAISGRYSLPTIGNRLTTCQVLMDLGADKNVVDAVGLTALGRYRKSFRDNRDFFACIGNLRHPIVAVEMDARQRMEDLLIPSHGPTLADKAMLGADSDEEDEDDMLDSEAEEEDEIEDDEDEFEDDEIEDDEVDNEG